MAGSTDFVFSGIRTTIQGMSIFIETFFKSSKRIIIVCPYTQTIISIFSFFLELAVNVKIQQILQIPPFPGPEKIKLNSYMKMQIVICIAAINIYTMDQSGYVTNLTNTSNSNM